MKTGTFLVKAHPDGVLEFTQQDEPGLQLSAKLTVAKGEWSKAKLEALLDSPLMEVADNLTAFVESWRAYLRSTEAGGSN